MILMLRMNSAAQWTRMLMEIGEMWREMRVIAVYIIDKMKR